MSLANQINEDLKQAMRDKKQAALRALRAIKSAILLANTEKGAGAEMSDADFIKVLQKLVKQREDSISIYEKQGRTDLANDEIEEMEVIKAYLPQPLDDTELESLVQGVLRETGASTKGEMGKVIGLVSQRAAGRADGKRISQMVGKLLS